LGAALVAVGLLVFVTTILAIVFALPTLTVVVVGLVGALVVGAGWLYLSTIAVVELNDDGYRVRLLRGSGVTQARWSDVEDVVSAHVSGAVCLALRLRDGRSTVIPVAALAGDRDTFAQQVRDHLTRGQGLRPLSENELPH
jgi:hypothetical protein